MADKDFSLHPCLENASLETVCDMANSLVEHFDSRRSSNIDPGQVAFDLSYMLEYLRLNYVLVERK
jgi:hypothetical protein